MTVPDALLRAVGLEPCGPLGPTSDGVRLAVQDARGRRWALTVVPADDAGRVRERVRRLAGVLHDHLAQPGPCLDLADGSLAVLQAEVPGADLATVRRARGPWTPGEVVTVVVPLAEALAALHDAGLAHGDVAPANVMLRPDGRPVLVDLVCADGPDEAGTPGLAAPERPAGATPESDVYALGRLGATLLSGPGAVGGPGLGALLAALAGACAIDPGSRPSARTLAADVYAACPPTAIDVPDAAVLARLALRRLAVPDAAVTLRTARRRSGSARPESPQRARHRASRRRAPLVLAVAAGAALVAVASVGVLLDRDAPQLVGPPDVRAQGRAPLGSPVVAAVELTRTRVLARAAGDPAALAGLTVVGSPAWRADRAEATRLAARAPAGPVELRIVAAVVPGAARCEPVLPPGATSPPAAALRAVGGRDHCPPTVRVMVDVGSGVAGGDDPAAVVLVLRPTPSGWRVSAVEPYAP